MRRQIRAVKAYYLNHIWCGIFTIVLALAVILVLITKLYLSSQYTDYLVDRTYETEEKILQLANSNIDIMMDEFIQMGCLAATDDELYDKVKLLEEPNGFVLYNGAVLTSITSYAYYSQWIQGITILTPEEVLVQYWHSTSGFQWNQENVDSLSEVYTAIQAIINSKTIPLYSYAGTSWDEKAQETLFHLVFPLVGRSGSRNTDYFIVFSLLEEVFADSLKTAESQDSLAYGFIVDGEGRIVYHEDSAWIGADYESYVEGAQLDIISASLKRLGWTLHIGIDMVELRENVNELYRSEFILFCLWAAGICVILFLVISRFTRPIRYISDSIDLVKQGDYDGQIEIQGSNEIWQLADEFNGMTRAVARMRAEVEEEHRASLMSMRKMQEAEKEALESQINAHFICNTIGAINYEAIEAGNRRISTMLKKLSNILRYTFDQRHQMVYMEQEIAWLEQYLYLQKVRYEDKFEYRIEMPPEAYEWPCCKLIFQPFVENSIIHGFAGIEEGGRIDIVGRLRGEELLEITIQDNGCGMPEETREAIRLALEGIRHPKNLGIGIANVASRLKYYYGERASLSLLSEPGRGTVITLVVPDHTRQA